MTTNEPATNFPSERGLTAIDGGIFMAFSLRDALRYFFGGDNKPKPFFKTEKEAYDFCVEQYRKNGGATDELRRAYEFYLKNYHDDGCEPFLGPSDRHDLGSAR